MSAGAMQIARKEYPNARKSFERALQLDPNSMEAIAGLVSDQPLPVVRAGVDRLRAAAAALGSPLPDPFMTLSFLALSPIPELKVTDLGLVDAVKFERTGLFIP